MSTGWWIGYVIGGVLVVVVVVLLMLMIRGASRAADKAEAVLDALLEGRDHTAALWDAHDVNVAIERITDGAGAVRRHLTSKGAPE